MMAYITIQEMFFFLLCSGVKKFSYWQIMRKKSL